MNFCPYFHHLPSDLGEIPYQWPARNACCYAFEFRKSLQMEDRTYVKGVSEITFARTL
jgi:hypothetical protein